MRPLTGSSTCISAMLLATFVKEISSARYGVQTFPDPSVVITALLRFAFFLRDAKKREVSKREYFV